MKNLNIEIWIPIICLICLIQLNPVVPFEQILASNGLCLLTYSVETADGHILTMHRVVSRNPISPSLKPVIVQHGLFGASSQFFVNSPLVQQGNESCGDNFGICLALTGRYDAWYPNARGNGYSDGHVQWSSKHKYYWNFSIHEMALDDMPAIIDFVRKVTGSDQVGYIGYSEGATIMFALLSSKPEYARIVRPFIAWAPPVFLGHMTSLIRHLDPTLQFLHLIGGKFESMQLLSPFGAIFCTQTQACGRILGALEGRTTHLNESRIPQYLKHFLRSTSVRNMVHYGQLYRSKRFVQFDYGNIPKNIQMYGRPHPPEYRLEDIPDNYPIVLFYGLTDALVSSVDVQQLITTLTRDAKVNLTDHAVASETWNHVDFVIGMGAGSLVYDHTIRYLDNLM